MRIAIAGGTGTVGHHVVAAARERGHDVIALTRRNGHDIETGGGLAPVMSGADAVIDVSNVTTTSAKRAVAFFERVTANLLRAEEQAGVSHHVALSVVGIDNIDASYYAGKLAQERAVAAGAVPSTILRAAQFHEFAEQVVRQTTLGPVVAVPKVLLRPVAAREVAARLVEIAEADPAGRATDLVGPRDERLIDLVRAMLRADGVTKRALEISLPGAYWRGTASGVLRGLPGADTGRVTFDEWLRTPDHSPIGR
jgi:uncharacterized protein YbjT (DUF2867 family)